MSNCDFVAGRSLIDLLASRLALRAPALRAASALTQANQSAQWLPSGRHRVPTVKMVGPSDVIVLKLRGRVAEQPVKVIYTTTRRLTCTSCGKRSKGNAEFCSRCGTALIS